MTTNERAEFDAIFAEFKELAWNNDAVREQISQAGSVKSESWLRALVLEVFGKIRTEVVGRITAWLMTNWPRLFR